MKKNNKAIWSISFFIVFFVLFTHNVFAGGFSLPVGSGVGAITVSKTEADATTYETTGLPCRATITGYRGTVFVKRDIDDGPGWARAEIRNVNITYGHAQWMVNGVSRSDIAYP